MRHSILVSTSDFDSGRVGSNPTVAAYFPLTAAYDGSNPASPAQYTIKPVINENA